VARIADPGGQSTVEWVGLICMVALAVIGLGAAAGIGAPGLALAEAIGSKLVCAIRLTDSCEPAISALERAYGTELAPVLAAHAPTIRYEEGIRELPVDYRSCRSDPCSTASGGGAMWLTDRGDRVVAFTHVVDCREQRATRAQTEPAPDCSGARAGHLYLQYWLYYPDSQTDPFGEHGYHRDDWESFQVRLGGLTLARASSHHSYNYEDGPQNWPSDAGVLSKSGWGPFTGDYYVSAGSHAGHVAGDGPSARYTPRSRLQLIPIESIARSGFDDQLFEVVPPWLKPVYLDPESKDT
jgi:hypothetical protein